MAEAETFTQIATQPNKTFPQNTDEYLEGLRDKRTARHASEEGFCSPLPSEVGTAVRSIREDLHAMFKGVEENVNDSESESLHNLKEHYWQRASRVGIEHGARAGYELDDYFKIGIDRSYASIKDEIMENYSEGSIPRSVLAGIGVYHEALDINPSSAATITMELVSRNLADIKRRAGSLQDQNGISTLEANRLAFEDFINSEVPRHITTIIDTCGTGDKAIRAASNKLSFYPATESSGNEDVALLLSKDDAQGMIKAYDIQSRPYTDDELFVGGQLAQMPQMQAAMLRVHEDLVDFSESYLSQHPERASGNLKNFSEIFVPEYGDKLTLLPNPKLVRAMVNNVMPAVAKTLIDNNKTLENMTKEDVLEGVHIAAKEYKLFQTNIGQFENYNDDDATTELHSVYKVVCPANAMFPDMLTAKLGSYFEEEKLRSQTEN